MNIRNFFMASVATAALTVGASTAHAVTTLSIDDFNGPNMALSITSAEVDANGADLTKTLNDNESSVGAADGAAAANILGGYRTISTTALFPSGGNPSNSTQVSVFFDGTFGTFDHNQPANVTSSTTITWDGLGDNALDGIDISAFDLVEIGVVSADQGILWNFLLRDTNGVESAGSVGTNANINSPESVFVDLTALCGANGIDCTSIDAIVFTANVDFEPDVDTVVDFVQFVDTPEPATLTILGAGLLGLGAAARRRRTKA